MRSLSTDVPGVLVKLKNEELKTSTNCPKTRPDLVARRRKKVRSSEVWAAFWAEKSVRLNRRDISLTGLRCRWRITSVRPRSLCVEALLHSGRRAEMLREALLHAGHTIFIAIRGSGAIGYSNGRSSFPPTLAAVWKASEQLHPELRMAP
ncbi:hypothetical protein ON010_g6194 [Phytophthora cinnamomi]|nr:hypothetical protein ON010_g6194 [Phytophthora cinnamomi]